MTELNRAGQVGSLGHIDTTQGDFRQQIDALTDITRQLAGNPSAGDPLNAPYTLYVNPVTGSDKFVGGSYTNTDNGDAESKLRRIELQRLECGYTEARPFKTINRAVLEAGIITSKAYLNLNPAPCGDLISIVLSPGVHTVINDEGNQVADVTAWADGYEPDAEELKKFNDKDTGGLILPRGCSLVSLDLRKTIVRPSFVPAPALEAADYSNRRTIFSTTGGNYITGFTILDKKYDDPNDKQSHHLLHAFEYTSKAVLDEFYLKIKGAFQGVADLSNANTQTRLSEYQIVGPLPATPTEPTDTVTGASPYIFNVSLRSVFGMGGIFADGSKVPGSFRSLVTAQFTGVSLQKDLRAFQSYDVVNKTWVNCSDSLPASQTAEYVAYIALDPNNVRPRAGWRSFHIRAVNKAVIQEVSVFCIGQQVHHWSQSGGEITITNSNSSFGNVSALAEGHRDEAQVFDQDWTVQNIRRPISPLSKTQNVERIQLGLLKSYNNTQIVLTNKLAPSPTDQNQPELLTRQGYSFSEDSYVWVENPAGGDYRAKIAGSTPWTNNDTLQITGGLTNTDDLPPLGDDFEDPTRPLPDGFRVYIRRLKDTRTVEERRYTLQLAHNPAAKNRLPIRDYVLQRTTGANDWSDQICAVINSENATDLSGELIENNARVELRYSKRPSSEFAHDPSKYYRKGDVVLKDKKHYIANSTSVGAFEADKWSETYVHMDENYCPEGNFANATPVIIFDKDTDGATENTTNCGYSNLTDNEISIQIESATDYQGLYWQILNWNNGNTTEARSFLVIPSNPDNRDADVSGRNWKTEMRRPSNLRLYGHSWEWSGYSNYTKALPDYQGTMLPQNKFTYYFTNANGGKVYASGFNEEGFQITPRGVEDLATGEVLSVDSIGSPDRPINIPTIFDNIQVNKTLTVAEGGEWIGLPQSKVNEFGIVEKADYSDVNSAKTDDAIAASKVITVATLDAWKVANNLVSSGVASASLYIDPVDGKDITDLQDLIDNPPENPAAAVKSLAAAAKYANTVFSPETTVTYNLFPGVYDEGHTNSKISFSTNAKIRAWDGDLNQPLNDPSDGGTKPFMMKDGSESLSNFTDIDDDGKYFQPIFPTYVTATVVQPPQESVICQAEPVQFDFKQEGSVTGCVWWGVNETLLSTDVADSSFPSGGNYSNVDVNTARTNARAGNTDNAYNYFIREAVAKAYTTGQLTIPGDGNYRFFGCRSLPAIKTDAREVRIQNVGFGAVTANSKLIVGGRSDGFIQSGSGYTLSSGIYFFGQLRISSEVNINDVSEGIDFSLIRFRASAPGVTDWVTNTYAFTGTNQYYIESGNSEFRCVLGHRNRLSGGQWRSNYRWNNFNMLARNSTDDGWSRATLASSSTPSGQTGGVPNWKLNGPALSNFISGVQQRIGDGTARLWNRYGMQDSDIQGTGNYDGAAGGFDGVFGYGVDDTTSDDLSAGGTAGTALKTRGVELSQSNVLSLGSISIYTADNVSYFTPAGAPGPKEPQSGVINGQDQTDYLPGATDYGEIGNWTPFNVLNVDIRGYRRGTDVETGNTVFKDEVM